MEAYYNTKMSSKNRLNVLILPSFPLTLLTYKHNTRVTKKQKNTRVTKKQKRSMVHCYKAHI